jgi:hypothetical protein
VDKTNRIQNGHDRIKHAVHSYWRQNTILSPKGKFGKVVMSCLYFSLPVVVGYFLVTAVVDKSESTVPERFGDKNKHETTSSSSPSSSVTPQKIGAGGWGGGVNLATSDKETQDVNRINLERFMKKQRRLKEKREREAAAAAAATAAQE